MSSEKVGVHSTANPSRASSSPGQRPAGLVERLKRMAGTPNISFHYREDADAVAEAASRIEQQDREIASLRLEAQSWKMEAACHKSSLHEAYQAVTGATGEPGNWNGAKPITEALARYRKALEEIAAEEFNGPPDISIYAAAANELTRRQRIARQALNPADTGQGDRLAEEEGSITRFLSPASRSPNQSFAGKAGGYAPGSYECRCGYCGEWFEGDKRAVSCLPCAEIVRAGHQPEVAWGSQEEADAFEVSAGSTPLPGASPGDDARVAAAWHDGFISALGCRPWEAASDFAILVGQQYARGEALPSTMPRRVLSAELRPPAENTLSGAQRSELNPQAPAEPLSSNPQSKGVEGE